MILIAVIAGNNDQLSIQGIQYHGTSLSGTLSSVMKSSATITTFKAHLKTELFAAAYDTV